MDYREPQAESVPSFVPLPEAIERAQPLGLAEPRSFVGDDQFSPAVDERVESVIVVPAGDASIALARRLSRTCSTRPGVASASMSLSSSSFSFSLTSLSAASAD